jgi:hypothetical protein
MTKDDRRMQKYLFLDTNYFEHFPMPDNVDWLKLANCKSIVLLIAPITISELNKHKDGASRPKHRERAAGALRKLASYARQTSPVYVRDRVELKFTAQEPLIDFACYRLAPDISDDRLLAAAIEFATANSLSRDCVAIVTADLGLELKTGARTEVHALPLPDSLRLPDEIDEDARRVRALQEQLDSLKAAAPNLSIVSSDGSNVSAVSLRESIDFDEDSLKRTMEVLRGELPYLAAHPAPPNGWRFLNDDPRILDAYNQRLSFYFEQMRTWLSKSLKTYEWHRLTIELELHIKNEGGKPATDIEVELGFPDGLQVLSKDQLREFDAKPEPPLMPTGNSHHLTRGPQLHLGKLELHNLDRVWNQLQAHAGVASLHNEGTRQWVRVCVPTVKHQRDQTLPSVFVHFENSSSVKSFPISYEILASNHPKTFPGTPNVVVKT